MDKGVWVKGKESALWWSLHARGGLPAAAEAALVFVVVIDQLPPVHGCCLKNCRKRG